MSSRRLAYSFRLPWHRALLAVLLPLLLAARQLWLLMQPPQLAADEPVMTLSPWSLPLWALGTAAALLWLLWVMRFCRQGEIALDEEALTVQRAGRTLVVPYLCIRSISLLRRAGYQWLRLEHEEGLLRVPQAMLPTGKAFDKLRRTLRHMARRARQSSLIQGLDSGMAVSDEPPSVSGQTRHMKWRLLPWLSALAALTALLWWMALAWLPTAPSFDWAVREILAHNARGAAPFDPRPLLPGLEQSCLTLDELPAPDGRSVSASGMAWHEDFIDEAARPQAQLPAPQPSSGRRLEQLRALADAGMLERTRIHMPISGVSYPATRFRLSRKGWESSGWGNPPECLSLGWRSYMGLSGWRDEQPDSNLERSYYVVNMHTALDARQLPYWAVQPAIQRAFADKLTQALLPESRQMILVREASGWAGMQLRERAARTESGWKYWQREARVLYGKLHRQALLGWNALLGKDAPGEAQIRQIIEKLHGASAPGADARHCLGLPAPPAWPVDEELPAQPPRYSVAVYAQQAAREPGSRVLTRTQPYLQRLAALGVLRSERRTITARHGPQSGQPVQADVYELAEALQSAQSPAQAGCLLLGQPHIDIVSLEIAPASAATSDLLPRFRYRLLLTYPSPPAWAQRHEWQAGWPELRDALERGQACEGEFAYDSARHEHGAGVSHCRWAFDVAAPAASGAGAATPPAP